MKESSPKLSISALFLGILFYMWLPLAFTEEVRGEDTLEKTKFQEFEKKLEKLTEDVENIIKNRMEEKGEMSELGERLNQLTQELKDLKVKPAEQKESKSSFEPAPEISLKAPTGEHLYFEGLGVNEDLPERAISLDRFRIGLWAQYRLMFNASNIPGPGGTNFGNTKSYNFLQQRIRIALDIRPFENVGGYTQFEFRNAWGVGTDRSDPSESIDFDNIAFNRLDDRGLRYAYFYASPIKEVTFVAGIIPSSDYLGDTQFSADWDFNVGGLALTGIINDYTYRLSYLRLIEGLGFDSFNEPEDAAPLVPASFTKPVFNEATRVGLHIYSLINEIDQPFVGDFQEVWIGGSGRTELGLIEIGRAHV